jgi:type IV pilus assembly protein PilB
MKDDYGVPKSLLQRYSAEILGESDGEIEVRVPFGMASAARRDFSFASGRTGWSFIEAGRQVSLADNNQADRPSERTDASRQNISSCQGRALRGSAHLSAGSATAIVDEVLSRAIEVGASDVHIEPFESAVRIRYRIDGVLQPSGAVAKAQKDAVISRLKILASLDIAEKRRPQDGRIRMPSTGAPVDLRISTIPTSHGEKAVVRILDRRATSHDLDLLGLPDSALLKLRRELARSHGMILVTGPTGSGKTTTLYAALQHLNTGERNILSMEDPVEYQLEGVNQTQVRADIGLTFAAGLRAFLRQDPDVIMVGEIRDSETAEIAVRAALTGHLVLSTLHTNDAASTVGRLLDMGVEPFLVAGSVRLVIAQRLVRLVCRHCAEEVVVPAALQADLRLPHNSGQLGRGCESCNGTGYSGRRALFEVMPVRDALAELIAGRAPFHLVLERALEDGLVPLRDAARELVIRGETTPQEALRAMA